MTLQEIENRVRFTKFIIDGKVQDLTSIQVGHKYMPRDLLRNLINEAVIHIQMETNEKAQIKHDNFTEDSAIFALPTDFLAVQAIEIFDDENTTGLATAVTSYSPGEGHMLEKVGSREALRVGVDDDAGQPTRFMLWQQGSNQFILLNMECDADYFFDIYYFPMITTLSIVTAVPELASQWHGLIYDYACVLVAQHLRDYEAVATFLASFERKMAKRQGIIERRRTPHSVRFLTMP